MRDGENGSNSTPNKPSPLPIDSLFGHLVDHEGRDLSSNVDSPEGSDKFWVDGSPSVGSKEEKSPTADPNVHKMVAAFTPIASEGRAAQFYWQGLTDKLSLFMSYAKPLGKFLFQVLSIIWLIALKSGKLHSLLLKWGEPLKSRGLSPRV